MRCTTVHNQQELDQALAAKAECIHIDSKAGVWLELGSSRVVARGSSRVEAWGSSRVEARDSSRVVAWGSSSVVAWGSSRVVARGSSRVEAWGSSSVEAWGSSSVVARDSSRVEARGSSRVEARDSSRVEAWAAASVHAHDRSTTNAGQHVAVHVHSGQATINGGGVLIDLTQLDLNDPQTWCEHHGVKVRDGMAVLFKAVDQELVAGHEHTRTSYPLGGDVTAEDWRDTNSCGYGLHVSPTPAQASAYCFADTKRFLRVVAPVGSLRPIGDDKCKVPSLTVEVEVDRWGDEVAPVGSRGGQ